MKPTFLRISLLAAAAAGLIGPVAAEDIDLFTSTGSTAQNPNIVILIDNSANWDSNAQHWTCPTFSPCKQGQSELRAIRRVLDEVDDKLNLGLMLFTPGPGSTPSGSYVRYHVRQMTTTNKNAYKELIGQDANCVDGPNSLTGSPNCILKNFSAPNEKVGTAKTDYSAGLFEVFKYFGGYTDPAHAHLDQGMTPIDASHFGALRYARTPGSPDPNYDAAAYSGATQTGYNPPLNADGSNSCAKNFLVFIGNGYPVTDSPASLLTGVNGNATQLQVQTYNTTSTTTTTTLGTDATCTSPATCATNAATTFPGYDSYACTGGTPQSPVTNIGTDPVCESNAACVTRAQTTSPGHVSYSCTGGTSTPVGSATGTDTACETQLACNGRTSTILPGYSSYGACGGGTTGAGVSRSATDTTTESRAACAARARTTFPGYNSYSCSLGTAGTATTVVLGDSGLVCETQAACSTRMAAQFPGHDSVFCVGVSAPGAPANSGSAGPFTLGTDAFCDNVTQCKNRITIPAGSNLVNPACSNTGLPTCSNNQWQNMPQQASCAGGTGSAAVLAHWVVKATDTPYTNQTMNATGCNQLSGQTFTAFNTCLSGQTMQATDTCIQGQSVTGTKTVTTTTPGAVQSLGNFADEWARYLYTTDANAVLGQQNITTYTIDVYKDAQDANETALLQSMAKYGGGRYFQATNEDAILNALRQILVEIQAVNSVFASASLPINATNRSQNENQVFIGMFRPDEKARPKWYGNLKRYQVAILAGDAKLADANLNAAISATTGFITACAQSFYTSDNGANYWSFSPASAGTCTSVNNSANNDLPDGGIVEKGSVAEVLRKGNSTTAVAPFTVSRKMQTCPTSPCTSLVDFTTTNPTQAQTGASTPAEHASIVSFTKGADVVDENGDSNVTEPRPSIHGDIAHSRPLPVNYGDDRGVVVFYGSNDGAFHAVKGSGVRDPNSTSVLPPPTATDGTELWSFIAPEHFGKLRRLLNNTPIISYPNLPNGVTGVPKDYFFDGSVGLYQTFKKVGTAPNQKDVADKVWIFPSMRRGGRMLYAFDVADPANPALKWTAGCPDIGDDNGCTAGMTGIGQTWSVPAVASIKGYNAGGSPVVIVGGGYDSCEDTDDKNTSCTAANKGNHVYVFDAGSGALLKSFDTDRAVPADVTLIDRDFDGNIDFGYVVDTGGNLYRIDFSDPSSTAPLSSSSWKISKIAQTTGSSRKFLFAAAGAGTGSQVFLAMGSGDRERPLIQNYPYSTPIQNRFYMFIDKFPPSGTVNLDGATMSNFTSSTSCDTKLDGDKDGWYMDLPDRGEQTVTSAVIFGGTVFFSTNRPVPTPANSCQLNLGEAKGYAVNLLNASGVIGSGSTCGGTRSGVFTGGGLPPSPVVGTVPVAVAGQGLKTISVLIGGINLDTGTGSTIGAQQPPVPIRQIRSKVYWYPHGDK